jgi:RNA polymerase sigma factor (sigma-70 family)
MIETALIERASDGDRTALGELARLVYPRVVAFCCSRVAQRVDAEDLAQETLLRAFASFPSLKQPDRIGAWLRGIAAHVCNDWHRRHRVAVSLSVEHLAQNTVDPIEALANADEKELIQRSIQELPPKLQEVVFLFYFEELTYDEIAKWLGVARSTVNLRLSRAREILRSRLGSFRSPSI